jgi:putative FmdB family regulatory protein
VPTYDYECEACQFEFEERQKITDPVLVDCPKCGKIRLIRRITGGLGIRFGHSSRMDGRNKLGKKIEGFYGTDYKNKDWLDDRTQKG